MAEVLDELLVTLQQSKATLRPHGGSARRSRGINGKLASSDSGGGPTPRQSGGRRLADSEPTSGSAAIRKKPFQEHSSCPAVNLNAALMVRTGPLEYDEDADGTPQMGRERSVTELVNKYLGDQSTAMKQPGGDGDGWRRAGKA